VSVCVSRGGYKERNLWVEETGIGCQRPLAMGVYERDRDRERETKIEIATETERQRYR